MIKTDVTLDFDDTQATEEGWCISQCSGSRYIPEDWYDLQRWDENTPFDTDFEAEMFVCKKAIEGSEYHRDALLAMEEANFAMVRKQQSVLWDIMQLITSQNGYPVSGAVNFMDRCKKLLGVV